jgi:hypothetical protein
VKHILEISEESDRRNVVTALAVNGYKVSVKCEVILNHPCPPKRIFTVEYEDKEK